MKISSILHITSTVVLKIMLTLKITISINFTTFATFILLSIAL